MKWSITSPVKVTTICELIYGRLFWLNRQVSKTEN